jgi:hypothetical protein
MKRKAQKKPADLGITRQRLVHYVTRQPFRPFGVRLVNGAVYWFDSERRMGSNEQVTYLLYLAKPDFIEIMPDDVCEIINGQPPKKEEQ